MAENRIQLLPEKYYHIYNHANGNDNLFREPENYRYFLQKYFHYIDQVAETLAWCLMPNHFHFFIKVKLILNPLKGFEPLRGSEQYDAGLISKQFANLFNGYSQAYNKKYLRRGSLFNQSFKRKEILETDFVNIIRYIHCNPVKHGFVKTPEEWSYSSYNNYISKSHSSIYEKIIKELFDDIDNFRFIHESPAE